MFSCFLKKCHKANKQEKIVQNTLNERGLV